ncbi:hypothetical protein BJ878DRAFT_563315 [Calycina marina]|uniref:Uncharacterized protein n=1 Tax=Calycina marina TaxID=1763456 RepID=A0A9P7ZCM8_9HELO|nr:hypothetical protein BJ878DRAFT_563315 [Calycina marina]
MSRVFCITGKSSRFGNHLVQEVVDKGDIPDATARSQTLSSSRNFLAVKLHVTKSADIECVLKNATDQFGCVGVVVGNAGLLRCLRIAFRRPTQKKDAQAMYQLVVLPGPPLTVVLGSDTYK